MFDILPRYAIILGALCIALTVVGQSFGPGDLAFVGYNADGEKDFAIVLLKEISNDSIYFSDNELNGAGGFVDTNEGVLKWVTGPTAISAGTVIIFSDIDNSSNVGFGASLGTLSRIDGNFNFGSTGDAIFAYHGTAPTSPSIFIGAIQNTNSANSFGDLTGSGLDACTAMTISNTASGDGAEYSGLRNTADSFSAYLDSIKNITNWTTSTTNGESLLPFDATSFSIISACATPSITGRDTTICIGDDINLKNLLIGTFQGGLRYGTSFGVYSDTITTLASPISTTTYDSVDGTNCVDTAQITVNIMDCSIPCDIEITFSDTICNADGTYTLKVAIDSTGALSDRVVALINGVAVDTLPYPVSDGMDICIDTGLNGDSSKSVQLIIADTGRAETILFVEDFESDGNGSRYTTSIVEFFEADSDFFGRTDGSNIGTHNVMGQSGLYYFGVEDVDANGASDIDTLRIENINISLSNQLVFKGLFAEEDASDSNEDWDGNTEFIVQYQIDNGGFSTILQFSAAGGTNTEPRLDTDFNGIGDAAALTPIFTEFSSTINGTGQVLDLLLIMEKFNDGDEDIVFDNLMIKGQSYICSDTLIFNEPFCQIASIATIADPCDCCNPDNIDITGDGVPDIFKESVTISSNTGETWTVGSSTGLLDISGNSISSLSFIESPLGTYSADFYHSGGTGYSAKFTNGASMLSASNSCASCLTLPSIPDPCVSDIALCYDGQKSTNIVPEHADPDVLVENFETDGLGTRYFLDRETFTTLGDTSVSSSSQGKHFLIRTDGSNIRSTSISFGNVQGEYWFGASDLNKNLSTISASATMTFPTNSIKGLCDLTFSVFLAEADVSGGSTNHWNKEDFVHFDYSIDDGSFIDLLHIESDGGNSGSAPFVDTNFDGDGEGAEVTGDFQRFSVPIDTAGDSITIRISMFLDATDEDIAYDSISILGVPATYNFYDGDPSAGGSILAANQSSYDPMVTKANSPQTIWVESLCGGGCKGNSAPITVGVHPDAGKSIICNDQVNVALGEECNIEDIDITAFYAGAIEPIYFDLELQTEESEVVEMDSLHQYVGDRLIFEVIDTCTLGRCWGYLTVEDKLPPQAKSCPCDASISSNLIVGSAPHSCKFVCLDSVFFHEPLFTDNCWPGMTADAFDIYLKIDSLEIGCDSIQYMRSWLLDDTIDDQIETHEICKQVYYKLPLPLDSILWPSPKLVLACDSVALQAPVDQIVASYGKHFAGPYYINNVNDTILLTNDTIDCHLPISYKDTFIQTCANESRITRTWSVLDWCTQSYFDSTRLIDVSDKRGPDFGVVSVNAEAINDNQIVIDSDTLDASDLDVSIDLDKIFRLLEIRSPYDCSVDFEIPIFDEMGDNCSPIESIRLEYAIDNQEAYFDSVYPRIVRNVGPGSSKISITAYDECGNSNVHSLFLVVLDKSEPIALCQDTIRTTLIEANALLDGGISQVPVSAFDHSSYDECGDIILTLARRQDSKFTCGGNALKFIGTDYIEFCCDDIGEYIPVELTFFDDGGNQGKCISIIQVENKNEPSLDCEDVVISCDDPILPEHLGYPYSSLICSDFELTYTDEYHVDDLCYIGFITREWSVVGSSTKCNQIITIRNDVATNQSQFDPESIKWPLHFNGESLREIGIDKEHILIKAENAHGLCSKFSFEEYEKYQHSIDVEKAIFQNSKMLPFGECELVSFNEPSWIDPGCGLIGKTFEDQSFIFNSHSCRTILRNWVVIDWCSYDSKKGDSNQEKEIYVKDICNDEAWFSTKLSGSEADGYYTFIQEIRIIDQSPPQISVEKQIIVDVVGSDYSESSSCDGLLEVVASAQDYCGELVNDLASISWELKVIKINVVDDQYEIIRDKYGLEWMPIVSDDQGVVSYLLKGKVGETYHLKWRVVDGCNNKSEELTKVIFSSTKAPIIQCHSAISTHNFSSHGEVRIWASDLAKAFACSGSEVDVWFKDEDGFYDPYLTITCSDVVSAEGGDFTTMVYAVDSLSNESFCEVSIRISGDHEMCDEEEKETMLISGAIITEKGDEVELVQVNLSGKSMMTERNGLFSFEENVIGKNYMLSAFKNDDVLNGVSALDLLHIQNHILGIKDLESPYQLVAADINKDDRINILDLLALRRVILGIEDSFQNNTSWRFTDELDFEHHSVPVIMNETVHIEGSSTPILQDLIGIKIGDVSGDVLSHSGMTGSRSETKSLLTIEDQRLLKNEIVDVPIVLSSINELSAFQLTMDVVELEFVGIFSSDIEISESNIGIHKNALTLAWTGSSDHFTNSESFTLRLRANQKTTLQQGLSLSSDITPTVAFQKDGKKVEMILSFDNEPVLDFLEAHPNPFYFNTTISFASRENGILKKLIYSSEGKVVYEESVYLNEGKHLWEIKEMDLPNAGIYYYQIESDQELISGKVIHIK